MTRITRIFLLLAVLGVFACDGDESNSPPPCKSGTEGCACAEGTCEGDLFCGDDSICAPSEGKTVGLTIGAPDARACEIMFVQSEGSNVISASYGVGTHGALRRRDPNVAIALSRESDSSFDAESVSLLVGGAVEGIDLTARCFDATGSPIENPQVSLN